MAERAGVPDVLACSVCDRTFEDRWRCACGAPLDFAERPLPDGPPAVDPMEGLWAFDAFLPVDRTVSLGEGFVPAVESAAWDCTFTLEYASPTGSFKDRGATTTLSRAVELGVDRVVEDSSGNAGAAVAAYAAHAGVDARIYVPASVAPAKRRAIARTGAEVVAVEGDRGDVTDACVDAVEAGEGWYASHAWNPAFHAGTATFAIEVAARRDWGVPDAVVLPVGHGTLLLGAYRGFRALAAAGWTDGVPRLLCAQAAGCAPLVEHLHGPRAAAGDNDAAAGIQIRNPPREAQLREAVDATGGDAVAVDADATASALDRLHRRGFAVEPTSAVAPAALTVYRERGVVGPDDDVVVPLTGAA